MAVKSTKNTKSTSEFRKAAGFLNVEVGSKQADGSYAFKRLQPGAPLDAQGTALEKQLLAIAKSNPSATFVLRGSVRLIDAETSEEFQVTFE